MGCSIKALSNCAIFLAMLDLIHALATLGYYSYQLYKNFRCHWAHGIRACEFYLNHTNHSVRVNIGVAEGVICLIFAIMLAVAISKQNLFLVWSWMFKGVAVVILNMYFILDWLIKRGRYYHSYWSDGEYDLESLYINAGISLTMFELFIVFVFCCVSGSFTYRVRKIRKPNRETAL